MQSKGLKLLVSGLAGRDLKSFVMVQNEGKSCHVMADVPYIQSTILSTLNTCKI